MALAGFKFTSRQSASRRETEVRAPRAVAPVVRRVHPWSRLGARRAVHLDGRKLPGHGIHHLDGRTYISKTERPVQ